MKRPPSRRDAPQYATGLGIYPPLIQIKVRRGIMGY